MGYATEFFKLAETDYGKIQQQWHAAPSPWAAAEARTRAGTPHKIPAPSNSTAVPVSARPFPAGPVPKGTYPLIGQSKHAFGPLAGGLGGAAIAGGVGALAGGLVGGPIGAGFGGGLGAGLGGVVGTTAGLAHQQNEELQQAMAKHRDTDPAIIELAEAWRHAPWTGFDANHIISKYPHLQDPVVGQAAILKAYNVAHPGV